MLLQRMCVFLGTDGAQRMVRETQIIALIKYGLLVATDVVTFLL
jgi:hypothetical protein